MYVHNGCVPGIRERCSFPRVSRDSRVVCVPSFLVETRVFLKRTRHLCRVGNKDVDDKKNPGGSSSSFVDAAVFRLAELLGILVLADSNTSTRENGVVERSSSPLPSDTVRDEVEKKIENLYRCSYFFCGQGSDEDWAVFGDSCVFADEFSSFVGTARFRRNVTNFGKFLKDPECTLTKLEKFEDEDGTLSFKASWIFRSRVRWINGLLAAAGETTYIVRDGQIVRHDEAWKTPKSTVFRNILFNRSP